MPERVWAATLYSMQIKDTIGKLFTKMQQNRNELEDKVGELQGREVLWNQDLQRVSPIRGPAWPRPCDLSLRTVSLSALAHLLAQGARAMKAQRCRPRRN